MDHKDWQQHFVCECGAKIDNATLHQHMQACAMMQKQYAQIYQALGQQKNRMQRGNLQFTKNILFLLKMFTENIFESFPELTPDLPKPAAGALDINVNIPSLGDIKPTQ